MSKKHPGRDTEFATFKRIMKKMEYQLKKEDEENRKKNHEMNPKNWKKKKREEDDYDE